MEKRIFKIKCDRNDAEELMKELKQFDETSISINEDEKNFIGAVEILSIIASVSTIAANALMIWIEMKNKNKKVIEIEEHKE